MDSFGIANEKNNNEEKAEDIQLLVPVINSSISSPSIDSNRLQVHYDDYRPLTRSICAKSETTTLSRRPSATVTAIQSEHRRSTSGNILFEYIHPKHNYINLEMIQMKSKTYENNKNNALFPFFVYFAFIQPSSWKNIKFK